MELSPLPCRFKMDLCPLFTALANNPSAVSIIDFINIWGMILVGLGLILGLLTRWASLGGVVMLFFYFVAYPPSRVICLECLQKAAISG